MAAPTKYTEKIAKGVIRTTWATFTTAGAVSPAESAPQFPDKTVIATSTRWGNGSVQIEGSNIAASGPFQRLKDPSDNLIALTSGNPVETILDNAIYIRARMPTATADALRSIKLSMISQSTRR